MRENRLVAETGGVPAKLVAPARPPDPARAEQILRHIAATEDAIAKAKEEAAERQGVAGSLSQTAVVTQALTLAQLRLAYLQISAEPRVGKECVSTFRFRLSPEH